MFFWGEGWVFYWELQFWDMDFVCLLEDCIGMFFWCMYCCVWVIWLFGFYLGEMILEEVVEYFVENVGYE